jgi:hypothetical protein
MQSSIILRKQTRLCLPYCPLKAPPVLWSFTFPEGLFIGICDVLHPYFKQGLQCCSALLVLQLSAYRVLGILFQTDKVTPGYASSF